MAMAGIGDPLSQIPLNAWSCPGGIRFNAAIMQAAKEFGMRHEDTFTEAKRKFLPGYTTAVNFANFNSPHMTGTGAPTKVRVSLVRQGAGYDRARKSD